MGNLITLKSEVESYEKCKISNSIFMPVFLRPSRSLPSSNEIIGISSISLIEQGPLVHFRNFIQEASIDIFRFFDVKPNQATGDLCKI